MKFENTAIAEIQTGENGWKRKARQERESVTVTTAITVIRLLEVKGDRDCMVCST